MPKRKYKKQRVRLFLDSGAFSAWNRGKPISLDDYIEYLKDHAELIDAYVNMDVIPGEFGSKRTETMLDKAAEESYKNLEKMWKAGLDPIPVFHQGEKLEWFDRMLADGVKYIGVSSSKDMFPRDKIKLFDEIFSRTTDRKGRPVIKVHGFGTATPGVLMRYPWYTIDSTTWSLGAGYGHIKVPPRNETTGEPNFFEDHCLQVIVSGIPQKAAQDMALGNLGEIQQQYVIDWIENVVGCSVAQVRNSSMYRRIALLVYFMELTKALGNGRFDPVLRKSGFLKVKPATGKPYNERTRFVFATSLNREWGWLMNKAGVKDRLLSYFELKDKPGKVLEEFVMNGIVGGTEYEQRRPATGTDSYATFRQLRLLERLEAYGPEDDTETPER